MSPAPGLICNIACEEPIVPYKPVDSETVAALRSVCGDAYVMTDRPGMEPFSHDYTEDLVFYPEVVVRPRTTAEVQAVMRLAYARDIPVTPRGGGTGLSGGALPIHGGILLSIDRMNAILEIDTENMMGVLEPGVITQVYQEAVEAQGLFYPPDPASKGSCTMGGNVAECAGGPRAAKYGVTRDWIYALDVVMPDGRLVRTGSQCLKDVTGYNLTQLFVGSEGTLGVVTQITTRLMTLPPFRQTLLIAFATMEQALATVVEIFRRGYQPSACEFMERAAIQVAIAQKGAKVPHADAEAQLLIEVDGFDLDLVENTLLAIGELAMENEAVEVTVAQQPGQQKTLWDIRRACGEAVKSISIYKEEDAVVPRKHIVTLMRGVQAITKEHGITAICYGHAGDGNIHINILKMDMTDHDWNERLPGGITAIFELVVSLGGRISGEHGIGYTQRPYLPIALSSDELDVMRQIKAALDPKGLLNPDKIFI
ncbi:MAG: FAD-binding protein [Candidatus Sericytochromatia bacterium]|nr:FAD-binding protein [Candidatus Sericytochromatia bacterium]